MSNRNTLRTQQPASAKQRALRFGLVPNPDQQMGINYYYDIPQRIGVLLRCKPTADSALEAKMIQQILNQAQSAQ